jgi:catechol 2,3-dioxygenase-like lactoylglutathione lyase family enzyme
MNSSSLDPAAALSDLQMMHLGMTVPDLDESVEIHRALGVGPWAVSAPIDFTTYDGADDCLVVQQLRLAFGRLPGGLSLELIQPMSAHGPHARLLASRPGLNHVCYWVHDMPGRGRALLGAGAAMASVSSAAAGDWDRAGRPGGIEGLLDATPAAVFRLKDGLLIELLSVAMWHAGGLHAFFGPVIEEVVTPPAA